MGKHNRGSIASSATNFAAPPYGVDDAGFVSGITPEFMDKMLAMASRVDELERDQETAKRARQDPALLAATPLAAALSNAVARGDGPAASVLMASIATSTPAEALDKDAMVARALRESTIMVSTVAPRFFAALVGDVNRCSLEEVAAARKVLEHADDAQRAPIDALIARANEPAAGVDLRTSQKLASAFSAVMIAELDFWARAPTDVQQGMSVRIDKLVAFKKRDRATLAELAAARREAALPVAPAPTTAASTTPPARTTAPVATNVAKAPTPAKLYCKYCKQSGHVIGDCQKRQAAATKAKKGPT